MLEIYGRLFRWCIVSVEKYQTLSQQYEKPDMFMFHWFIIGSS